MKNASYLLVLVFIEDMTKREAGAGIDEDVRQVGGGGLLARGLGAAGRLGDAEEDLLPEGDELLPDLHGLVGGGGEGGLGGAGGGAAPPRHHHHRQGGQRGH